MHLFSRRVNSALAAAALTGLAACGGETKPAAATSDAAAGDAAAGPDTAADTGASDSAAAADTGIAPDTGVVADAASDTPAPADVPATPDVAADTGADALPADVSATGAPTFGAIYTGIFKPNGCTNGYCHGGGSGGLKMGDEATAYANLINIPAKADGCSAKVRVSPGKHAESLLWQKVAPGVSVCEGKMPDGSPGLDQPSADLIAAWIDAGAKK